MNLSQHIVNRGLHGLVIISVIVLSSCSPSRYVPEGEYLLGRNHIKSTQKKATSDPLKGYIIQKPNKRVLGTRFFLFLYNLSDIHKEKMAHSWLRKIGEEPVIYDPELTRNSVSQLSQYLENKGYYNNEVKDSVVLKRRGARVTYFVDYNKPYRIRSIMYTFEDTGLVSRILPDTANSLLQKGRIFDKDYLQQERIRIETVLKEQGYYSFSKEYIFYNATIDNNENSVDLVMHIKEFVEGKPDPHTKVRHHPKYMISKVYVYPNITVIGSGTDTSIVQTRFDTMQYRGLYFLNSRKPNLKPNIIVNSNDISPGAMYKLSNVTRTYRNLTELSIVRYANITFREKDSLLSFGSLRYLDCRIELTQKKLQSFQTELAGTNSAGDLGVRGNLLYQNVNLFRGAEVFNMRFTGAIEALKNRTKGVYKSMKEIGAESNVVFPKFFSPFRLESFVKKYAPKTSISVSFNYQSRPDYTRSIANSSFSYRWKGSPHLTHTLFPLELYFVNIYENYSQASFLEKIRKTPLGYSFLDHVINVARYGFELNNQAIGKSKNFIYTRFNIESAGNLVYLADTFLLHQANSESPYSLFKVPYFQYLRSDIDFRYYNVIDKQNRFVYRLFIGVGYPYGNSATLPYEKKYFSGGPNGIRAWNTRELGPGSYVEKDTSLLSSYYYNQNGDIKLEANVEYRFKIIWKMEGAIFLDAGNVWAIRKDTEKPGAEFNLNRFYKEIAIGTGIGFRFDFTFFLLRIDFGMKVRDPAIPEKEGRWIPVFKEFGSPKFGIGFPF